MKTGAAADKRRLRIALLVDRFGNRFGGAEAYGVELMRVLARRHDVTVVAREYDSDLALPYLPVRVSCRLPSWLRVLYFAWRAARLTREGFDIVHSHMNGGAGDVQVMHVTPVRYNWLCRPGLGRRLTAWTSPRVATYLALEKARVAQRPGKRVVAVSELIVEQMRDAYGVGLPMETIPPGVQLPAPADPARRAATRAALGWGEDDLVCLLVARNPLRKGLPALLAALAQLPDRYRLLVVGADGPARQCVGDSGLPDGRVHLVDPTPGVAPYYEAADIYVHPTLNDSYGMAPLEAMSHGLPVVVSSADYCGFAQYLADGRDALILRDPRDGAEVARAVAAIGEDAPVRAALSAAGLALARAQSWEAVAARYETLYETLLRERAAG